ncbi:MULTISPECIES: glycoside hydrolase family 3 N-terminal domain-containing protein [unclassified Lentimonas]|uniref:glycoside hydrolase family 3 protein n=1 Tax=unclassified Lentimonas TaxID=2630993 RepID=UPI00132A3C83|nr:MULTISPECIES: glycoside hydrolase family 3 N-terminal domain-containing protein [unclassified Lentimonas]CAA6679355.1 Beta-glucosidase (EC [Lentimonas sp. CC4]CAA6687366.1 Beta-glucosidase (EC [Lentimonas sp. CC6]CAA7078038.1 Beta-glucosidase (EC [Lentimonas sp. CC4]CAA7168008.1 Beta-glucosidase (EC [Lentimonas sp. CC21]CAA7179583.1 Beta-glucosidase (EC [Lentimonas sp. CC8]
MINTKILTPLFLLGAGSVFGTSIQEELLTKMTLDEKVGQMVQVDSNALLGHEEHIAKYFIGSLLSGGGSDPLDPAISDRTAAAELPRSSSPEAWTKHVAALKHHATTTRLGIPIIFGVDAVHGHNNVDGAVIFPHNIGLGATRNPDLVEQVGRVTALEVAATGIDWTFAPCVAVARNERWGRTYESFSESPDLAGELGAALTRGLQGADLSSSTSILACAKHYVGDGGTMNGIDRGDVVSDEATLRALHIEPFQAAIDAGTLSIMASYNSWNGQKLHGHDYLIREVLKGEMKYSGFVISDWAAIDELPGDYKSDIETSVNAGIDMFMIPTGPNAQGEGEHSYIEFITLLKELVDEGKVSLARIDDAVLRILTVKAELGLFETPKGAPGLEQKIGSEAHRAVARESVRQSLVLLQNKSNRLPLAKSIKRISVAGRGADNLGMQCGGWSIGWQGEMGEITSGGTTILEAIRATVSDDTEVVHSADGSDVAGSSVAVVVVGEAPYAEGKGDRESLDLDPADQAVIQRCHDAGVPVVLVLLSGRPLLLGDALEQSDAIVAAWLPGTEARGIADVLFGDFAPVGKLPFTWAKSMDQVPMNVGDPVYDPLFEFGFGLEY